jgi:polar amino acid transport system permease protein
MLIQLDFWAVLSQYPLFLKGIAWTLALTAVFATLGFMVGVVCAWARVYGSPFLKFFVGFYVELIRNTPFIVQLFFIYFGLPALGLRLSPEVSSIIAMVVNLGAYATEIIRAGIEATPKGQIEAALSLALTRIQLFTRVILPPALKKIWSSLTSQIIIVMLGSAVCGQISTQELSYAANLIQSRNFRAFESFIVATFVYLCLSIALRGFLNWFGNRFLFQRRVTHG